MGRLKLKTIWEGTLDETRFRVLFDYADDLRAEWFDPSTGNWSLLDGSDSAMRSKLYHRVLLEKMRG